LSKLQPESRHKTQRGQTTQPYFNKFLVALLVIVAVILYNRRNSSARLKEKFGPEYDQLVRQQGDSRLAENVLVERERRVSALNGTMPGRSTTCSFSVPAGLSPGPY
jgi:hypothetical protein